MFWLVQDLIKAGVSVVVKEAYNGIRGNREQKIVSHRHQPDRLPSGPSVSSGSDHVQKDLQSSISFFEEGIAMLQMTLDRMASGNVNNNANGRDKIEEETEQSGRLTTGKSDLLVGFFGCQVQEMAIDVRKLKSASEERFAWSKSSFKTARIDATRAFHNETLSTNDRILAAKVRIMSAILGCLEEPDTATIACKVYLKELNAMSDVSEQFCRHFRRVDKVKDEPEILTSVALINYVVFCFTETLAKGLLNVNIWPRIKIFDHHSLHPIRSLGINQGILRKKELNYGDIEPQSLPFNKLTDAVDMAVNSKGEFIVTDLDTTEGNSVKVFSSSGVFQFAFSPSKEEMKRLAFNPRAVSIDKDDNIYVYTEAKGQDCISTGVLFVFDNEGTVKRQIPTECCSFMALQRKTNRIVLSCVNGIYMYENSGECLYSIEVPELLGTASPIGVCDEGEIVVTDSLDSVIHIITDKERRQFKVNEAGGWKYVAFNYISGEIIVSYLSKELSHFQLKSYSKSGRLLGTMPLPATYSSHPRAVTVTPNGRIAVLYENNVHLI